MVTSTRRALQSNRSVSRNKVDVNPIRFIKNNVQILGQPFSFTGREYLHPIYETCRKNIILKFSRQCEKSTTLSNKMAHTASQRPYFRQLYVTPSQDQTRAFSSGRFKPIFEDSPSIKHYMQGPNVIDQVFYKRLSNMSEAYFRSAFHTADRTRGLSADLLAIDELQDIQTDHMPVIEETISHSPYGFKVYSGTPKTTDNTIEKYWNLSTRKEWTIACSCSHWNILGIQNIGKTGLICAKCGKIINARNGMWLVANPSAKWDGYRVCQLMVPWIDWHDILDKYEQYEEARFYNEVLGQAWDEAEKVITEGELRRICQFPDGRTYRMYDRRPANLHGVKIFAGIDWGKGSEATSSSRSYSVISIVALYRNRFILLYAKKYKNNQESKPHFQIEHMAHVINRFGCTAVGADHGFGFMQNPDLRKKISGRPLWEFQSSHNAKEKLIPSQKQLRYTVNRTKVMSDLFGMIKRHYIVWPDWSQMAEFAPDFLGVYREYNHTTRMMLYDHPTDVPDDFVHSLNYSVLATQVALRIPRLENIIK